MSMPSELSESRVPLAKSAANRPWLHRTPDRTWYGPLETTSGSLVGAGGLSPALARSLHMALVLTRADFRGRYRAQALGIVWSLLNPLVMMTIISLVFARVFRTTTPNFPVFVLQGLLVWQWITNAATAGTISFVVNAELVKRTVFAREVLPIAAVLSYGINFLVESMVLLVFVPIFPHAFHLSSALLAVPVLLGFLALLLIGATLATSALNVIYRDVAYGVNMALAILYWLTPVFYPPEVIPQPIRSVLAWNPAAAILAGLRNAVMFGQWPSALGWLQVIAPTLALLGIGYFVFARHERMALDHV